MSMSVHTVLCIVALCRGCYLNEGTDVETPVCTVGFVRPPRARTGEEVYSPASAS